MIIVCYYVLGLSLYHHLSRSSGCQDDVDAAFEAQFGQVGGRGDVGAVDAEDLDGAFICGDRRHGDGGRGGDKAERVEQERLRSGVIDHDGVVTGGELGREIAVGPEVFR